MSSAGSFPRIRISCLEGRAQSVRLRQSLFHSLHAALTSSESTIKQALAADTSFSTADITLEYGLSLSELRLQYESLDLDKEVKLAHSPENPNGTTSIGIVYIVPAQKNLLYSVISPLCAALAAGNCVVLQLPPTLSQVSSVLRKLLQEALDADVFAISDSRPDDSFLSLCHVVVQSDNRNQNDFSDSTSILPSRPSAMVVAMVDRTANVSDAARSIALSKRFFRGKSHYAPDIVLVSEWVADELLSNLVREIAAPLILSGKSKPPTMNGHANGHLTKPKTEDRGQSVKDFENQEGVKVVVSGDNGSIVEITSRDLNLLHQKIEGPVTVIYRVSSLDDAIDLSNSFGTPLDATYIFATPEEAIYVSRYIDTRISYVNHIPVELLVGPSAPIHPTVPTTAVPRYTSSMFRRPAPRLVSTSASALSKTLVEEPAKTSAVASVQDKLAQWSKISVRPLPATGQDDGKALGFFDAAFLLLGGTVLSVLGTGVFFSVRYLRRR